MRRRPHPSAEPRSHLVRAGVILALLLGCLVAWYATPIGNLVSADRLAAWGLSVRESLLAPLVVTSVFVLGTVLMVPISLLILASALAFGPGFGLLWSLLGTLVAAAVTWLVGRGLGQDSARLLARGGTRRMSEWLSSHGLGALTTARLVPVAHFTTISLVAGAARVPLGRYLVGTMVGMTPLVVVLSLFARPLERILRSPTPEALVVLVGSSLALVGLAWAIGRRVRPPLAS